MSNNFLVFSHEQDVDGLFSAAVLRMIYPQSEVILTNYGFENMVAIKNKILSFTKSVSSGTRLYIGRFLLTDIVRNVSEDKQVLRGLLLS
jgi:hypothetical protein